MCTFSLEIKAQKGETYGKDNNIKRTIRTDRK